MVYRTVYILLSLTLLNCNFPNHSNTVDSINNTFPKGALLTTSFNSFEEFKEEVTIKYSNDGGPRVELTHVSNGGQVVSILKSGVSEADFVNAKRGNIWDKVSIALASPYFVSHRHDLLRVYTLSRRKNRELGWPDKAFFDIAETMKNNISKEDLTDASPDELSEKGYINTFNHIVAQAFITTLFSEDLADYVADVHERKTMPALITGNFTEEQMKDIKNGVVDNYVDIINNEWGQEFGKRLKQKYNINANTNWTPELLTDYLNEFQSYFSRVFKISFKPFTPNDKLINIFSNKINLVMKDVTGMTNSI